MAQQIETKVFYPESDGQPMGETELHRQLLTDLVDELSRWLAGRADAHVSGNVFIYYVKGDPHQFICPDVFVAFGSHKRLVNIYQTWRDGPFPQVVIELTSRSTRAEDEGRKRDLYERLGVMEYYLFDPHFEPFDPAEEEQPEEAEETGSLKRHQRLAPGLPFGPVEVSAPSAVLHSELLGLGFTVRGRELRLMDEATGRQLPTLREAFIAQMVAEEQARAEAQAEAQARQAADKRARAEAQARRAEAQARRAEAQARQAAEERAQALAEELDRLRAERERDSER